MIKHKKSVYVAFLFLIAMLGLPGLVNAQTATILGTVTDGTGAVVPQAKVTVTNTGTNVSRETETNETGLYRIGNLTPAIYIVLIEKSGFQSVRVSDIQLTVGQILTLDAKLEISQVVQTIEVSGQTVAPIELNTATLSNVVDQKRILNLPLLTRDPYELISLSPGVTPTNANGGFAVNGSNDRRNNFLLDGTDNNDTSVPGIPSGATAINPDSTQEFRVITSGYLPEYGRNTGAIIDVITRSGTNRVNGTAYWFGRYSALGARDFFNTEFDTGSKDPYVRNQFGGSLGGPVIKDKTFWFANYEGARFITSRTVQSIVPSSAFRTGIFTFTDPGDGQVWNVNLVNPASGQNLTPLIFGVFSGLDPLTQSVLAQMPAANGGLLSDGIRGSLFFPSTSRTTTDSFTVKIDHNFNQFHTLSGRYTFNQSADPNAFPTFASFPGIDGASFDGRTQNLSFALTSILKPTLVNELRVGGNRIKAGFACPGVDQINSVSPTLDPFGRGRDFNFGAITPWACFTLAADGQDRFTGTYNYKDNVTWTSGNHTLKFGGEIRFVYENGSSNFFSRTGASFSPFTTFGVPVLDLDPSTPCDPFSASLAGCELGSATFQNTLQELASILLGIADNQFQSQFFNAQGTRTSIDNRGYRQREFAFYIQDSWKIRSNLTLNLGLRYEWYGVPYEVNDNLSNLYTDPSGFAPFTFELAGPGTGRMLYNNDNNNFQPRIGFAWEPFSNGKSVIRGSYSIFNDRIFGNLFGNSRGNNPFTVTPSQFQFFEFFDVISNVPLPGQATPTPTVFDGEFQSPVLLDQNIRMPYVQSWNLGFQHELWSTVLVDVNYVGTKGTRLLRVYDGNVPSASLVQGLLDGGAPPSLLQFANLWFLGATNNNAFFNVFSNGTFANSNYNALQLNVTKRFSRGFQIQGSYTWSHAFDWASDPLVPNAGGRQLPRNSRDIRNSEYGQSDFDVRNRVVVNWVWEIPVGRGKAFANSGIVGKILEGWQFNGIATFSDGLPISVFCTRDSAHTGVGQRCDLAAAPGPTPGGLDARTQTGPTANLFANPDFGIDNIGNVRRNSHTIPGVNNWDFSLIKDTRVSENFRLEFRTEIFNAFNRAQLGAWANGISSPLFGQSTNQTGRPDGTAGSRQIQFALKLHFNQ